MAQAIVNRIEYRERKVIGNLKLNPKVFFKYAKSLNRLDSSITESAWQKLHPWQSHSGQCCIASVESHQSRHAPCSPAVALQWRTGLL